MKYIRLFKKEINEETGRCQWGIDKKIEPFDTVMVNKYDNVGMILPNNYCFVDFDTQDAANIARRIVDEKNLKCYEIVTDRGSHFGFKLREKTSQWTHKYNYYGLECDFKCGTQAGTVYERIRTDCISRQIIMHGNLIGTIEDNLDNLDYLPKEFFKVADQSIVSTLYGAADGDGRNDKLFQYKITLKKSGFSYEDMLDICNIINKYVFKEAISGTELGVITRRKDWDDIDVKQKVAKFLIDDVVNNILEKEVVYRYNDKLLWFIGGKYTSDEVYEIPGYITTFTNNLHPATIESLMLKLKQSQNIRLKSPNSDYVICGGNKLYNILTGEVLDNNADVFSIIDYTYRLNLDASSDITENNNSAVKDFIYYCSCDRAGVFSKEKETQILEMIGNALIPNKAINRCYFIKGTGANGKSKLKVLIETLVGKHSSFVSIDEFGSDFKRAAMFDTNITCNLQDDFNDEYIKDLGVFKTIISGGNMIVNPKYGRSSTKKCAATIIVCTNEWPRFKTEDDAINRRLMFIELENKPKTININLEQDLLNDYAGQEWLFNVSLKAITAAFKRGYLLETEKSIEMKDRRLVEIDDFVEYLFSEYYYDKSKLIYDEDDNICNNDYDHIVLPLKTSEEIKRDFYLYKGVDDIGFMMSTKKITLKIKKYCGKYYTNKDMRVGTGTKKIWHKREEMINKYHV